METKKFHIIVVDDTMGKDDPFVVDLELDYVDQANVSYFDNVQAALSFIEEHLSERMIVFMDCKFGSVWQGIDAVSQLRKKTALVYVVMMSANPTDQLFADDIKTLINTENVFFIKNTDIDDAKAKIEKITSLWNSRFDCVLEDWLVRHPEDAKKIAFRSLENVYTWETILRELRLQTEVGKEMEKMVNQFFLYQFTREDQKL